VHAHHHNPSISKPTGRFLDDSGSITRPELPNTAIIQVDPSRMFIAPPYFFFINVHLFKFWFLELLGVLEDHIFIYLLTFVFLFINILWWWYKLLFWNENNFPDDFFLVLIFNAKQLEEIQSLSIIKLYALRKTFLTSINVL